MEKLKYMLTESLIRILLRAQLYVCSEIAAAHIYLPAYVYIQYWRSRPRLMHMTAQAQAPQVATLATATRDRVQKVNKSPSHWDLHHSASCHFATASLQISCALVEPKPTRKNHDGDLREIKQGEKGHIQGAQALTQGQREAGCRVRTFCH